MNKKHFSLEVTENHISLIRFKNANRPMNVLEREVLLELSDILDDLADNPDIAGAVFISAHPEHFIVGANIEEIAAFTTAQEATEGAASMQAVFQKIASLKCPTVAAIHGQCLGGGLEMSLACDWRVITNHKDTKLALPEIQLGLIPGAGGTQRLPKVIGIRGALDMILTGRRIDAKKAEKIGLADASVPVGILEEQALKYALKKKNQVSIVKTSAFTSTSGFAKFAFEETPLRRVVYKKARSKYEESTKGFYPAGYKAIDAVFDGFDMSIHDGLALEAKHFGELAMTKESKSLIHLFNATTHIKKNPFKEAASEFLAGKKTSAVGVVGAGFMGAGIATVCADRGISVKLSDPSEAAVSKALASAHKFYAKKLDRRKIKPFELESRLAMISPGLSPEGLEKADVVIEAVPENLELKQKILREIEERAGDKWIFATNTSAIPVSEIAKGAKDPGKVIGMHFFSPVEKMPLLEVIKTDKTYDWVVGETVELGKRMGKQVIVVEDGPGFYTTRALAFFLAEAIEIIKEGCEISLLDSAITEFGFPVGPATLIDEVGIDVGYHVLETMSKAFPDRITLDERLKSLVDEGYLGKKAEKGLYRYSAGKKQGPDSKVYEKFDVDVGKSKDAPRPHQIVDRLLLVFVNESIRCLEEGILSHPHDGDVGAVFGLGFPPFWGGPFKYVDLVGAKTVVASLTELEKEFGPRFKPCASLAKIASEDGKFFPEEFISAKI